jgi:hypothetical protein
MTACPVRPDRDSRDRREYSREYANDDAADRGEDIEAELPSDGSEGCRHEEATDRVDPPPLSLIWPMRPQASAVSVLHEANQFVRGQNVALTVVW